MTDYPIIMSAPMVRALLDGRKTQTRRLAYRNPEQQGCDHDWCPEHRKPTIWQKVRPGNRLWVKETWVHTGAGIWTVSDAMQWPSRSSVKYRADGEKPSDQWFPSIHMPRWASRLTLTVTETRMQRVQEISGEDAKAEGLQSAAGGWWSAAEGHSATTPAAAYAHLWNSLHPDDQWDSNPEVVAMTFTVALENIGPKEVAA